VNGLLAAKKSTKCYSENTTATLLKGLATTVNKHGLKLFKRISRVLAVIAVQTQLQQSWCKSDGQTMARKNTRDMAL